MSGTGPHRIYNWFPQRCEGISVEKGNVFDFKKKINFILDFFPQTEISSKWTIDLDVKSKILNFSEKE